MTNKVYYSHQLENNMTENDKMGGYKIANVTKQVISDVVKRRVVYAPYVNYTPAGYISLKFDYLQLTEEELKEIDSELALLFPYRFISVRNRKVPEYTADSFPSKSKNFHWKVNVRFSKRA